MEDEELQALAADIKGPNGQIEDILTYDNQIIDGRNRYRACLLAGVEPRFREWDGEGSLVTLIVSLNLHRRHLTPQQRAMIAVDMLPILEAEAKERQQSAAHRAGIASGESRRGKEDSTDEGSNERSGTNALTFNGQSESLVNPQQNSNQASDVAGKIMGVSGRLVRRAKRLKKADPEAAAEVREGKKKLGDALVEAGIHDDKKRNSKEGGNMDAPASGAATKPKREPRGFRITDAKFKKLDELLLAMNAELSKRPVMTISTVKLGQFCREAVEIWEAAKAAQ